MSKTAASSNPNRFIGEQSIPGATTWNGTPPTGETKLYRWNINSGLRQVTIFCSFVYTAAGVANSQFSFPLPNDMPNAIIPTGLTGASVILYVGTALISTGTTTGNSNILSTLRRNAADNGFSIFATAGATLAAKYATLTLTYFY